MLFELIDIHAGYNGREILTGISIKVNSGEIVCLIGPNGAGKSTVLKVASGFIYPKQGRIFFDGTDITHSETYKRILMGMNYFLQGGAIFTDMTAYENLKIAGSNIKKNVLKERIEETIALFPSMKDNLKKRAGLLSGGEKQMLALGMIIINKPQLLLLDEPSAGLSPNFVKGIMNKIIEINKTYNMAILLVEQNISESLKIAGKCYLLKNGRVVFEGVPEEIKFNN